MAVTFHCLVPGHLAAPPRFLASIRHPNVVGFLEAFLDDRKMELCVVMEYADGGDLAAVIEKHRKARRNIDENTVWAMLLQLRDGLQALHSKRIIHRGEEAVTLRVCVAPCGHGTRQLGCRVSCLCMCL